jgi:predicted transposase YbfD/YdcC
MDAPGVLDEAVVFLESFRDVSDPRQKGKVVYPLDEILLLSLVAVLAGADGFADIARFGKKKLDLLRRFRPYERGTPSHDQLGDVFAMLDADSFRRCFVAWTSRLVGAPAEVIAIDGKTSRRSYSRKQEADPLHMLSAFAAGQRMVLGQMAVEGKSNEITAIPKLLEMLAIEGAVVTIDAMGCQKKIARTIIDKKGDYVLALKGNQGSLREDVELFAAEQKANEFKDTTISCHEGVDGDHGRIETRRTTVIHDVEWLRRRHDWPGLKAIVMIESTREAGGKIENETRFYITSLREQAEKLAAIVRSHWTIENCLHWVLDMVFRDDDSRIRMGNAQQNFATLRRMAQNLYRRAPGRDSIRMRRKIAGWDDDFIATLICS